MKNAQVKSALLCFRMEGNMKNVLLIGDSIRMGYDKAVKHTLQNKANVYFPEENCRFAAYVLRYIHEYKRLVGDNQVDLLHWNAGLTFRCSALLYSFGNENINGAGTFVPAPGTWY